MKERNFKAFVRCWVESTISKCFIRKIARLKLLTQNVFIRTIKEMIHRLWPYSRAASIRRGFCCSLSPHVVLHNLSPRDIFFNKKKCEETFETNFKSFKKFIPRYVWDTSKIVLLKSLVLDEQSVSYRQSVFERSYDIQATRLEKRYILS